jgi:restriction system protein
MATEFVTYMPRVLDALRAMGGAAKPRDVYDWIGKEIKLPEEKRWERDAKGNIRFPNRVQWARQYLFWGGLIDGSQRNRWVLTPEGANTHLNLETSEQIVQKVNQNAEGRQTRTSQQAPQTFVPAVEPEEISEPPEEAEESRVLDVLQSLPPKGFEHFCKRLLYECGLERLHVTGGSHDRGIDGNGLLRLNPFVTIKVGFQCKRYKEAVGGAAVREFRGAIQGKAEKGIFITTGYFTSEAEAEANRDGGTVIELVDGERLVEIMQSKQLGVRLRETFDVDHGFFEQFKS